MMYRTFPTHALNCCAWIIALAIGVLNGASATHAAEVEIRVAAVDNEILIYEAVPIRVTIANRGTDAIHIFRSAFESGQLHGPGPDHVILNAFVYPMLRITLPDGVVIETQVPILQMKLEEGTGPHDYVLKHDDAWVWEFPLVIAWDAPERLPIFTAPGVYSVTALAYSSAGLVESAPATIRVRVPDDPAAQQALDIVRGLSAADLHAYYEPELASSWFEKLEERAPPAIKRLSDDDSEHPYRTRACLTLGIAYHDHAGAIIRVRDMPELAEVFATEAERLLLRAGPSGALFLARHELAKLQSPPNQAELDRMEYIDAVRLKREWADRALGFLEKADVEGFPLRAEAVRAKLEAHRFKNKLTRSGDVHFPLPAESLALMRERYPDLWSSEVEAGQLEKRLLAEFPDSAAAWRLGKELKAATPGRKP